QSEIADKFNISTRTVRRYLKQ
ncbi:HTH domain-containing protein, partial [Lactobacillus intestinalis]